MPSGGLPQPVSPSTDFLAGAMPMGMPLGEAEIDATLGRPTERTASLPRRARVRELSPLRKPVRRNGLLITVAYRLAEGRAPLCAGIAAGVLNCPREQWRSLRGGAKLNV
jgi:hypothetical protein